MRSSASIFLLWLADIPALIRCFSTILIDSGKTFLSSAVKQLPKNDISRVDAVFLSHIHADGKSNQALPRSNLC
jgi:glyoxylase-like metal-dependent hydrolase (beta-lactamase superfamily II)